MTMPKHNVSDSEPEDKPKSIKSLENILFNYGKPGLEPALRTLVANLRGNTEGLPKSYYTDIIERIFAEAGYKSPEAVHKEREAALKAIGEPMFDEIPSPLPNPEEYKRMVWVIKWYKNRIAALTNKEEK